MINIIDINLKDSETEEESGDVYHTAEVTLLEPGGAFSEGINEKEIKNTIKQRIKEYNDIIEEIIK